MTATRTKRTAKKRAKAKPPTWLRWFNEQYPTPCGEGLAVRAFIAKCQRRGMTNDQIWRAATQDQRETFASMYDGESDRALDLKDTQRSVETMLSNYSYSPAFDKAVIKLFAAELKAVQRGVSSDARKPPTLYVLHGEVHVR